VHAGVELLESRNTPLRREPIELASSGSLLINAKTATAVRSTRLSLLCSPRGLLLKSPALGAARPAAVSH
jgi:hypothetical protein